MERPLRVLFAAAELTPLAKVGGLGDVIGALPKSLKALGVDVRIVIPKYGIINPATYPLTLVKRGIPVRFDGKEELFDLSSTPLPGSDVPVYLIDHATIGGGTIYFEKDASSSGNENECRRFTFFANAIPELFAAATFWPDIVHAHDWHVGILPLLLKLRRKTDPRFKAIRTLFTIHNLAYQGKYNAGLALRLLGLSETEHPSLAERVGTTRELNYLVEAIFASDAITTVSPNYALEILTPAFGEGVEGYLTLRRESLSGIVNGIDVDRFNPETDEALAARYSSHNLEGKKEDKAALQQSLGLRVDPSLPLLTFIGRLTDQKGVDLLPPILETLLQEKIQFIILGTGSEKHEAMARQMAAAAPGSVVARIAFDAKLAQQLYAGADLFVMPSRFEPCGLGQMIAMRYGTVPVVRATGGLKDTVPQFNPSTGEGTGFMFEPYEPQALLESLTQAIQLYRTDQNAWQRCMENGMRQDFSWTKSSQAYLDLYRKLKTS